MTADGSGDEQIQVQGLTEPYKFTDADVGSEGAESEADEDEAELADVEEGAGEGEGEGEEDEEEAEEGMEETEDEDEDDTAVRMAVCGEAPPEPPAGFVYATVCPPLVSLDDKKAMVGRKVLTAQLEDDACGWYMGTVVSSAVGKAWKKILPTATHIIEYKQKETRTTKLVGKAAYELTTEKYGAAEWWLLLEQAE